VQAVFHKADEDVGYSEASDESVLSDGEDSGDPEISFKKNGIVAGKQLKAGALDDTLNES
jgi:hypothetical protein